MPSELLNINKYKHSILIEAIPLCEQNKYRKIRRTHQKVIYCFTMQLVSTQLWVHHQAIISNLKIKVLETACLTGSRSVYIWLQCIQCQIIRTMEVLCRCYVPTGVSVGREIVGYLKMMIGCYVSVLHGVVLLSSTCWCGCSGYCGVVLYIFKVAV
jgi:hypothetical protein